MHRALSSLLLICLLSPLAVVADERADTQKQIERTQKDIAELKKTLSGIQEEKSGVQKQLKSTETQMGDLEKQVKALQEELEKSEKELQRLDEEKKKLQGARLEQQRLIGIQARAAYQSGREEYLKLLLNQEHPEKFSRTLTYYEYINRARLEQLNAFNETLRQLENVERDITTQKSQQLAQQQDLEARRQELAEVRKQRQEALAKLNSDYSDSNRKLQDRQQAQAELNKVLKTIEETLARQAREAEEARQRALAAERERLKREQELAARGEKPATPSKRADYSGPLVSSGAGFGGAFAATASTARLTTSMTSSHSPSTVVNIASVRFGRPLSRTTRTASATYSATSSPTPIGVIENATSICFPPVVSRHAASGDDPLAALAGG